MEEEEEEEVVGAAAAAVGENPNQQKESPTTNPREPTTWETIESVWGQHACEARGVRDGAGRARRGTHRRHHSVARRCVLKPGPGRGDVMVPHSSVLAVNKGIR